MKKNMYSIYKVYVYTLYVLAVLLVAGSAYSKNLVNITQATSFPVNLTDNDSGYINIVADTLFVPNAFWILDNGDDNIDMNLNGKVINCDTTRTGGDNFILFNSTSGTRPNNIHVWNGKIAMDTVANALSDTLKRHGLPISGVVGCYINGGRDIRFDSVDFIVDGHNAQCGFLGSQVQDSIIFSKCDFTNWSESFSSRESFGSAVLYSNTLTIPANGTPNVEIVDCNVIRAPHVNILAKGVFWIHRNTLRTDAVNRYWDSTKLWLGITGGVGQSADNCYIINCRGSMPNTKIDSNILLSGQTRQGSRGILMECLDSNDVGESLFVRYNVCSLNTGPTGENLSGTGRGLRWRNIDSRPCQYISMIGNTVVVKADVSTTTSAIGAEYYAYEGPCNVATSPTQFTASHIRFINNKAYGISLSTSSSCRAFPTDIGGAGWATHGYFYGNKFVGSSSIFYCYDPAASVTLDTFLSQRDTFAFIDTTVATGNPLAKIHDKKTFDIGGSGGLTWRNNTFFDGTYLNGASDTNFVFGSNQSLDAWLKRTLSIDVDDVDGDAINGAQVVVKNAYGATLATLNTDVSGLASTAVNYWYEEENIATSDDSFGFNDFTLIAWYDADGDLVQEDSEDDTLTQAVTATSYTFNFDLTGVNIGGGTPPDTTVTIVTPSGTTVQEGAVASLVFSRNVTTGTAAYTVNFFDSTALAGTHYTDATISAQFAAGSALDTVTLQTLATVGVDSVAVRYCRATASGLPTNYVFANGISSTYIGIANSTTTKYARFKR